MLKFIVSRILQFPLILGIIYLVTFLLVWVAPGNPFERTDRALPADILEFKKQQMHADSALSFLTHYPWQIIRHGDFGESLNYEEWSVNDIIGAGLPVSATLGLMAITIAVFVGVAIGAAGAARRGGALDWLGLSVALVGISLPGFVTAGLLITLFAVELKWFPVGGWGGFKNMILPAIALSLLPMAYVTRLTRAAMIDVLASDYVRTARAKGLSKPAVVVKHALKNALLPVLSYIGPATAAALTGSFVVEKVFNIHGLGEHFVNSVLNRDQTLVLGVVMVYSAIVLAMNLLVDLCYVVIDPRIDLSAEGGGMTSLASKLPITLATAPVDRLRDRLRLSGRVVIGGTIVLLIVLACLVSLPWTATLDGPWHFDLQHSDATLKSPRDATSPVEAFGTDRLGRGLLPRVLFGGCISLAIGLAAAAISLVLGVGVGLVAGYRGGWTDAILMRIVDILYGLPYILIVVLLKFALEPIMVGRFGMTQGVANVVTMFIAIGAVSWLTMARVVRGQVLSLRRQPFIEAARAAGLTEMRIFRAHLLPNLLGPVIVYATLTVPRAILEESLLSFLGVGVQAPVPTWGSLASDGIGLALNPINSRWWLLLFPCSLLAVTLLALNFLGDGLRDVMDPKRGAARM